MKHDDCTHFLDALLNDDGSGLSPQCRRHLEQCAHCRKIHALDRRLEESLARTLRREPVSDHLLTMLKNNLDAAGERRRRFPVRPSWLLFPAMALLGIVLFFFLQPRSQHGLHSLDEIGQLAFADHHAIERVEFIPGSPDDLSARFSAKLGFPVQIPGIVDRGYRLIGGRLCLFARCNVAWLIYGHGRDRISLFIINAGDLTFPLKEPKKYILQYSANTVKIWQEKGQVYALVD